MSAEYETAMLTRAQASAELEYDRELERERDIWDSENETLDY